MEGFRHPGGWCCLWRTIHTERPRKQGNTEDIYKLNCTSFISIKVTAHCLKSFIEKTH